MRKKIGSLLNLIVALSMILTLFAISPSLTAAADEPPPDLPSDLQELVDRAPEKIDLRREKISKQDEISPEKALEKIDPSLREAALNPGKQVLDVYVSIAGWADVSKYLSDVIERPAVLGNVHAVYGKVRAVDLIKIAQEPGVVAIVSKAVQMRDKPYDPEATGEPPLDKAEMQARLEQLRANEVTYADAKAKADDLAAAGWFDVQDGHKSAKAWEKGFTGDGVIVGVLDDGIDFAHPDLQGTYAWVTDESSPYYGWPMAFSQVSAYYFAADVFLDAGLIQGGAYGSRYMDTRQAPAVSYVWDDTATLVYQPIDAAMPYEYNLPLTSMSGVYHIGSFTEWNLIDLYGYYPAVLVVDENEPGWYDTVYVDLDNDKDFTDEKPATQDSPEVYRDMNADGYADISGGLLVWISDGDNPPPTTDWLWGISCDMESPSMKGCPDNGTFLIFAGPFEGGYTHGTQCASNVAGQGMVNGGLTAQPFRIGGMVQGGAPDVGLMDFGQHYFSGTDEDEYLVVALGYDGIPYSGDEVQIASNSYGSFEQMWGSWGYFGRVITSLNLSVAENSVWLFSAGNEGPGYGPQEGDGSPTTIQVGSSTQYGSTNWDSIFDAEQITYGDPSAFYAHGPNRDGSSGVDVLANGGRGAGDEGLNYFGFDGATSWDTWGGTSRSSPVAAGNLALVFQAYKDRYGSWPTWYEAKALLKSGADNAVSSPFFQGGGVVNADRATDLAAGLYGVYLVTEDWDTEWQVGDWEGEEYLNFAKVAYPGDTFAKTFEVHNPSGYDITVDLSDAYMQRIGSETLTFTSSDESEESGFNFHSPDYLMEINPALIPSDAEVMIVRYVHPYDQFDPDYEFDGDPNSSWRFLLYNWTDQNADGKLWEDTNANGVVNHVDDYAAGLDNDGFFRPDYTDPGTEIQEGEYVRVDYEFGGLGIQMIVRDPLERMADGYFIGLQHRNNDHTVPTTDFTFELEFYKKADWGWLSLDTTEMSLGPEETDTFEATMDIPGGAEPGIYEGVILVDDPGNAFDHPAHQTAFPVVVNVIADLPDDGAVSLGGESMADTMYQNSWTNGYFNWYGGGWTGAGDWRHYFLNIDGDDVDNRNLLVHTWWNGDYPTDINTWVLGPTEDCASNDVAPCPWWDDPVDPWLDILPIPEVFGPYTLQPIASSGPFMSGATYNFETSTDGPDDWLLAPMETDGLYEVALHNVLYDGENLAEQFGVEVGTLDVEPEIDPDVGEVSFGSIDAEVYTETGEIELWFTPSLEIPDLNATLAGGLETYYEDRNTTVYDANQCGDDWNCPETVWEVLDVTEYGTIQLEVGMQQPGGEDIDIYLFYDADDSGDLSSGDVRVGSSTNPSGEEELVQVDDPDVGQYLLALLGWDLTTPTLGIDWYFETIYPGGLPSDPMEVYSDTLDIYQDDPFDPFTASFSAVVTTTNLTSAIHFLLEGIPLGHELDVYVTDSGNQIIDMDQSMSNLAEIDKHLVLTPEDGEYRFQPGEEYTVWVHGAFVPVEPAQPHMTIWTEELNVWLTASHPEVHVNQISAGEAVSVTLHFDKEGWMVGDDPLSARFLAGPSVLPNAVDELVVIERVNEPGPQTEWDPYNLWTFTDVETDRGESPFEPWGTWTQLGADSEDAYYALYLWNDDPFDTPTMTLWMEVDNFLEANGIFGGAYPYFQQTLNSPITWEGAFTQYGNVSYIPAGSNPYVPSDVISWTGSIPAGDITGFYWDTITDPTIMPGDDLLTAVYDPDDFWGSGGSWPYLDAVDIYARSFRLTGSYKDHSGTFDDLQALVMPEESFTYAVGLYNPSAYDREVLVEDTLPPQVELDSCYDDSESTGSLGCDTGTNFMSWEGLMLGRSPYDYYESIYMEADAIANAGLAPESLVVNSAKVYVKDNAAPAGTYSDYLWVAHETGVTVDKDVDWLFGAGGQALLYTITLENEGPKDALNVEMYDPLSEYLVIDDTTITTTGSIDNAWYADGAVQWVGDIPTGNSVVITFECTIAEDAPHGWALINAAMILGSDNAYPDVWYDSAATEVFGGLMFFPFIAK